jgi:hypothetical protein
LGSSYVKWGIQSQKAEIIALFWDNPSRAEIEAKQTIK